MILQFYEFFLVFGILFSLYILWIEFKTLQYNSLSFKIIITNVIKPLSIFGILLIITAIVYVPTITSNTTKYSINDLNKVTEKIENNNEDITTLQSDIVFLKETIVNRDLNYPNTFDDNDSLIQLVNQLEEKASKLSNRNDDLKNQIRDLNKENKRIYSILINSASVS